MNGIAISVITFEDDIILTGAVNNNEQKRRASDIAYSINGVRKGRKSSQDQIRELTYPLLDIHHRLAFGNSSSSKQNSLFQRLEQAVDIF